jgi:peroxiredoxin
MLKTIRTINLLTPLLLFCLMSLLPQSAAALLKKGDPLPELSGENITGEQFSSNQLQGQSFIIKLGTTWCGTCGSQSKEIEALRSFLSEKDIRYIDVFIQESAEKAQSYFDRKGYQKPDIIVLDGGEISEQLNVYAIPRLILVDKNMRVFRDGANMGSAELKATLQKMLAEN